MGSAREWQQRVIPFDVNGERVEYKVLKPDPMIFEGLRIPGDDGLRLLPATLRGELTFDYVKSSYLTNNLSFQYGDTTDLVQGTILWEKDPANYLQGRKKGEQVKRGESRYVFKLVFNPARGKAATGRVVANEKDLIRVSGTMATLTGEVTYWDDGEVVQENDDEEAAISPHFSRVRYNLHANRLTPAQVHNFLKMWLLMSGPVNDE